ncbi:hypothetical protein OG2516_15659 [Oceanicola granulosus HTCC2516]|uniref:Uncharacterized protein n=1 Tax=Oceanicola granulosus (strain ATCC BAA-861 / DSM 15982 / KCTC 12143 / HTCC2516) TaxID=314256 RepID=Q2CF81_OCEGH|nr:hypothetical protein [Oceanicola granulosus]EAR51414.1 hypothetical protein OG2516_15659 [Oceanicola granulosus HTCC2516]
MKQLLIAASALAILSSCGDGQPFFDDEEIGEDTASEDASGDDTDTPDGVGDAGDADGEDAGVDADAARLPPSADDPSPDSGIVRFEADSGNGGGLLTEPVVYDPETDSFYIDNLAFDGPNTYARGEAVASMNGYAVYEAEAIHTDSLTGDPINQLTPYRAIVGFSDNTVGRGGGERAPRTSFAIVRTGGYLDYGFGGFVYQREGGFEVPETGQAIYTGDYAGMRVFSGQGGLEYTEGDARMAIDFEDFNTNQGVRARVTNRNAYDVNGNIVSGSGEGQLPMPDLILTVEQGEGGGFDANGEYAGTIFSIDGAGDEYETGEFYAVLAGDATDADDGGEIVGVLVVESTDPRSDATAQETGGFILYRGNDN